MKSMGNQNAQLWDEEDGFFYDILRYPDGSFPKVSSSITRRADPAIRS